MSPLLDRKVAWGMQNGSATCPKGKVNVNFFASPEHWTVWNVVKHVLELTWKLVFIIPCNYSTSARWI